MKEQNAKLKKRIILESIGRGRKYAAINVKEDEELTVVLVGLDKSGVKDIKVTITGRGAKVQILGIVLGKNGETALNTIQHHTGPDTVSDLLIKSVMFGQAKLHYSGLIKIDQGAQRSNAYQRNENLLLSDQAYVESKPELEILANDVRCTHGATIGKIDEEILFYLMSRGIERNEAERLFIQGFFEPVLERIPDDSVVANLRNSIRDVLYNKQNSNTGEN